MIFRMPSGSNTGGSSGGGSPTGSAGGSLTGTYPNPTIATIPSGATATTQSAADASTKIATTAYVDTADALKANLAGPTFTGVVTLPTGTVGTTQSAADSSTKLATTAFATTADNLLAPLASPTFTGHPVGVTESAATNSTRLATTAYVDGTYGNTVAASGLPKIVRRTSDATAVTNATTGTTLTSDTQLLWAMGASDVWFFQAFILVNAANASMDAKFGLSLPASATATWGALATANTGNANQGGYTIGATAASPTAMQTESGTIVHGTAAVTSGISLAGVVVNSTNAGNAVIQWAQNTADAGNLLLKANSLIIAWRIA